MHSSYLAYYTNLQKELKIFFTFPKHSLTSHSRSNLDIIDETIEFILYFMTNDNAIHQFPGNSMTQLGDALYVVCKARLIDLLTLVSKSTKYPYFSQY